MAKTDTAAGDALPHLAHRTVLARILDTGLMGALLISLEGQVIFANEACGRMVGRETGDLGARNIDDLVHPDDRATSLSDLNALAANEAGKLDFERRYVRRDGR